MRRGVTGNLGGITQLFPCLKPTSCTQDLWHTTNHQLGKLRILPCVSAAVCPSLRYCPRRGNSFGCHQASNTFQGARSNRYRYVCAYCRERYIKASPLILISQRNSCLSIGDKAWSYCGVTHFNVPQKKSISRWSMTVSGLISIRS